MVLKPGIGSVCLLRPHSQANAPWASVRPRLVRISRLNQAVRDVVALPDIRKRMLELGLEAQAGPPEEIAARLKSDIAKWTKVIDDAHIPKL